MLSLPQDRGPPECRCFQCGPGPPASSRGLGHLLKKPSILGPPPTHPESNFLEVLPETAFFTSPQESPGSYISASGGRKPQEPGGEPALGAGEGETEEKRKGSVAQPVRTEPTTCPQHSYPATQVTGTSDCAGETAVPWLMCCPIILSGHEGAAHTFRTSSFRAQKKLWSCRDRAETHSLAHCVTSGKKI